jgi:hypothetical protein
MVLPRSPRDVRTPRPPQPLLGALLVAAAAAAASGCAGQRIPNTDVDDTAENREVVRFLEDYRRAVETRDVGALLQMASRDYYDDNGTPIGGDDVDFDRLREKLQLWRERVGDVRYEIRYRRVLFRQNRVYVDVRYSGSFQVESQGDDQWSRRLSDNRLVLRREEDGYRILSGM